MDGKEGKLNKKISKNQRIVNHLLKHKKITSNEAWRLYGVSRLSAVIWTLRHNGGYKIESYTIHPIDRFGDRCNCAEYHLIEEGKGKDGEQANV